MRTCADCKMGRQISENESKLRKAFNVLCKKNQRMEPVFTFYSHPKTGKETFGPIHAKGCFV